MSQLAPIPEKTALIPPGSALARVQLKDIIPAVQLTNHDKPLWDEESAGAKQEFRLWQKIATVIDRAPHGTKSQLMAEIASYFHRENNPWNARKIENRLIKFYKHKRSNRPHAYQSLIDRRRYPAPKKRALPFEARQHIAKEMHDYKGRGQRGATQAVLENWISRWHDWVRGDLTKALPGWPKDQPPRGSTKNRGLPRGFNYDGFHACRANLRNRTLSSQGPRAASAHAPKILTTRFDERSQTMLGYRQLLQIDDNWNDMLVNPYINSDAKRELRPVTFTSIDALTTLQRFAFKSQYVSSDTKERRNLTEIDAAWFIADDLIHGGYNVQTGTQIWGEGGTAHFKRIDQLAEITGGKVTFHTGGTYGNPAFRELIYKCNGGGNFRAKALVEGCFNQRHNRLAYLLAQVGPSPQQRPEENTGIQAYHRHLVRAAKQLPDHLAVKLVSPILDAYTLQRLIRLTVGEINRRTDHQIEGWERCGFTGFKWRLDANSDQWSTDREFAQLPADVQEAYQVLFAHNSDLVMPTRLSPLEAAERMSRKNIRHLDPLDAVELIPDDAWFQVTCNSQQMIQFHRERISPDDLHFYGVATNRVGERIHLERGKKYLALCNPYNPDWLIIGRTEGSRRGGIVGVAQAVPKGLKTDPTTFQTQIKKIAQINSEDTVELRVALQSEAAQRERERDHNDRIKSRLQIEQDEAEATADTALQNSSEAPARRDSAAPNDATPTDRKRGAGASPSTTQEPEPDDDEDFDDDPFAKIEKTDQQYE